MRKKFNIKETDLKNKFIQIDTNKLWFKTQTRVLYADTDAAGVIYHANYLRYFEIGRAEILRDSGSSYKQIEDKNIFHPIVYLDMNFYNPARYDDLLNIFVRPSLLETVKFTIEYKIFNNIDNSFLVEGTTVHCCTIQGKKVCEVDDITKSLFRAYSI